VSAGPDPRRSRARPRVKVVHVLEAMDGGTARHVVEVLSALDHTRLETVLVYSARRRPRLARGLAGELARQGIRTVELPMAASISPVADTVAALRLARLLRREAPDCVHLHSSKAGGIGRIAAAACPGTPLIYSPHAFSFLGERRLQAQLYARLEKALAARTDLVVAVSASERQIVLDRKLLPPERVIVVPNGVRDSDWPRPTAPASRPPRLGFLGRFAAQKNPQLLVEAAGLLRRGGVELELWMAGDGAELEACRRLAARVGLGPRVRFLGFLGREEVRSFYDAVDIFCLPSRYEGLPYSALDAMMASLPMVGFVAPGVVDVIRHEHNGLLSRPFSLTAYADDLRRLLLDAQLRRRLGANGRRYALRSFRLADQTRALAEIYRKVAARDYAFSIGPGGELSTGDAPAAAVPGAGVTADEPGAGAWTAYLDGGPARGRSGPLAGDSRPS
jgi:glycosyltransferase involved in cell wall biosynthesis